MHLVCPLKLGEKAPKPRQSQCRSRSRLLLFLLGCCCREEAQSRECPALQRSRALQQQHQQQHHGGCSTRGHV